MNRSYILKTLLFKYIFQITEYFSGWFFFSDNTFHFPYPISMLFNLRVIQLAVAG